MLVIVQSDFNAIYTVSVYKIHCLQHDSKSTNINKCIVTSPARGRGGNIKTRCLWLTGSSLFNPELGVINVTQTEEAKLQKGKGPLGAVQIKEINITKIEAPKIHEWNNTPATNVFNRGIAACGV